MRHGPSGRETGTTKPRGRTAGSTAAAAATTMTTATATGKRKRIYRTDRRLDLGALVTDFPAADDGPKPARCMGLPEAPTFRPSLQEFRSPLRYVESIAAEGKKYGIVKIVPPPGWKADLVLDSEMLSTMEGRSRSTINYFEQLMKYHKTRGTSFNKVPSLDRKPVDLCQLQRHVETRGGFNEVCKRKKWAEIGRALGYGNSKLVTSISTSLKTIYQRFLLPYEEFRKTASVGGNVQSGGTSKSTKTDKQSASGYAVELLVQELVDETVSCTGSLKRTLSFSSDDSLSEIDADEIALIDSNDVFIQDYKLDNETTESSSDSLPQATSRANGVCPICLDVTGQSERLWCMDCENVFHYACIAKSYKPASKQEWYCDGCLLTTGDFGFEDGAEYSLSEFKQMADKFKKDHFMGKLSALNFAEAENAIEAEFWRLLEDVNDYTEVEYGADIHSTTLGSGFSTPENAPNDRLATDPWNLNVIALDKRSLLRHIRADVSGMTVPWLYVGMCFSAFCWHTEDHYAYSINYQHLGDTKTWYGVPAEDSTKFENAMRKSVPGLFEAQPDLLLQLVTILSPEKLVKDNVKVYSIDQRPNQFVVTFPRAYHAGFNQGFNLNEAVNFAPPEWEPYGRECVELYQTFRKAPVFSHDELLINAAIFDLSIETAHWLKLPLNAMIDRELAIRKQTLENNSGLKVKLIMHDLSDTQYQCTICKCFTYLTQVICKCNASSRCLKDLKTDGKCHCSAADITLQYRRSDEELRDFAEIVEHKANTPLAWKQRFMKLLSEEKRPRLKSLRSLLAEAEHIAFPISELASLKELVGKANAWVDAANSLFARKHRDRKKNEFAWNRTKQSVEPQEKSTELPNLSHVKDLLRTALTLGFDCQEFEMLKEKLADIADYQEQALALLESGEKPNLTALQGMIDLGLSFNVSLPITQALETKAAQLQWKEEVKEIDFGRIDNDELCHLLLKAQKSNVPTDDPLFIQLEELRHAAETWDCETKKFLETGDYGPLLIKHLLRRAQGLPVCTGTLTKLEQLRDELNMAMNKCDQLLEKSQSPVFADRPTSITFEEFRKTMDMLPTKPASATILLKQAEKYYSWMRKGKRLVGKANSSMDTLRSHLQYVRWRNKNCFELPEHCSVEDMLAEAAKASARTPNSETAPAGLEPSRFCICRDRESGIMIECEICHEWYHCRCLRLNRKDLQSDEKYICPVCDHTIEIPRSHDRPTLDNIEALYEEGHDLPLIPDILPVLGEIIKDAQFFREHITEFRLGKGQNLTSSDIPLIRYYLRKIEGAEILLREETNAFRKVLHELYPVAPYEPQDIEESKSLRRPKVKRPKVDAISESELPPSLPLCGQAYQ